MLCARCSGRLVEITFDGESTFTMRSCANDHRAWTIDGRAATLAEVTSSLRSEGLPFRRIGTLVDPELRCAIGEPDPVAA
jgi:hypothetical protein